MKKICIIGASGKLGQYMVQHALDRGYEVVAVCRAVSVAKLERFKDRIAIMPGASDDRSLIQRAVAGCDGVLTVLVPWGMRRYSSGTAQAVLDFAPAGARLIFSCGWHISRDGQDVYPLSIRLAVSAGGWLLRLFRVGEIEDQVRACRLIFASDARWTVVRGSNLTEGVSEGLPIWSEHVGDAVLKSNLTRRIDFALFMVAALEDEAMLRQAPAIVGRHTPSARAAVAATAG
ncbi:short-chain dehydrogenase [Chromobacterium sp. LK11]|uniref:NAD(P)-dependent oxidoreductase n=1 Tax=Chromobacterium sp. LK11 TaxID=1628212 RepID=UPI0006545435|nr:NAD(P)H-binding protein [Chromobacterium sp. LK11]KMN78038.1 short-chain dehydrogenase [Chromobacterium sp. LK11]